jgi:hypothetical protein
LHRGVIFTLIVTTATFVRVVEKTSDPLALYLSGFLLLFKPILRPV